MKIKLFTGLFFLLSSLVHSNSLEMPIAFSLSPNIFKNINKEFKEGIEAEEKSILLGDHSIQDIRKGDFHIKNLHFSNSNLELRITGLNLKTEGNRLLLNAKISSLSLSVNDLNADYSIKKEKVIKAGFFKKRIKFSHSDSFKCGDLKVNFPKTNIKIGFYLTPTFEQDRAKMNISGEELDLNLDSLPWELSGCGGAPEIISKHFQKIGRNSLKKKSEQIKDKLRETLNLGVSYLENVFSEEGKKEFSLDLTGSPFSEGLGVKNFTLDIQKMFIRDKMPFVLGKLRADGAPHFFSNVDGQPLDKIINPIIGHKSKAMASLDIDFLNNLFIAGFEQLRSEDGVRPIDIKKLTENKRVIYSLREDNEIDIDLTKAELVLISPPYLTLDRQGKLKLILTLELNYQISMLGFGSFKAIRIQANTVFDVFHKNQGGKHSVNIKYSKAQVKDMIVPVGIGFFRRNVSVPGDLIKTSVNLIIRQYFKYFQGDKTTKEYELPSIALFGEKTQISQFKVKNGQLIIDLN